VARGGLTTAQVSATAAATAARLTTTTGSPTAAPTISALSTAHIATQPSTLKGKARVIHFFVNQYWGCVTFGADPDLTPFFSDFKDAKKYISFL
jgi:hypothetical protein